MALSCKLRFARFSAKLIFQDRAECGNTNESKQDFLHKILKDFQCIFQIFQFLVKLKPNENSIKKIICIDSKHIVLKPPYMKPKYLPLEPSKQKIECWIRVMVFDVTKKTYCSTIKCYNSWIRDLVQIVTCFWLYA